MADAGNSKASKTGAQGTGRNATPQRQRLLGHMRRAVPVPGETREQRAERNAQNTFAGSQIHRQYTRLAVPYQSALLKRPTLAALLRQLYEAAGGAITKGDATAATDALANLDAALRTPPSGEAALLDKWMPKAGPSSGVGKPSWMKDRGNQPRQPAQGQPAADSVHDELGGSRDAATAVGEVETQLLDALDAKDAPAGFKKAYDDLWSKYRLIEELDDADKGKLSGFGKLLDEALQLKAAAEQRMQAIRELNKDVGSVKALLAELAFPPAIPGIRDLRERFQQVKDDVDATDGAPPSLKAAADLLAELNSLPAVQKIKRKSFAKTMQAVSQVKTLSSADLKALDATQRTELLLALRRGGGKNNKVCREAMVKLHMAVPLEKGFKTKDKAMRNGLEDALVGSKKLRAARRDWATLDNDDDKVAALQEALKLQCEAMRTAWGIDIKIPPIVPFRKGPEKSDDVAGEGQFECGNFEPGTGKIKLNVRAPAFRDDFDETLNTIIHENTHNFQQALVAALEAGQIDQDLEPDKYQQAVLFQLNMPPLGYLNPEDVDRDSPDGDAYERQSTERHAWAAGKQAGQLGHRFELEELRESNRESDAQARLARAKQEGQVMLGRIEMTSRMMAMMTPGFADLDAVQKDLETALAGGSPDEIMDAVDAAFERTLQVI